MPEHPSNRGLDRLEALVSRLRGPQGCPWDREQTLPDVRAYLLEEAHEVAETIDRMDWGDLREELGDLLFQVVFIGRLAAEGDRFTLEDAVEAVERKMIDRHPHVFGDEELADGDAVEAAWAKRKLEAEPADRSVLDGVPRSMPALLHAYRVGQKAAALGFDWVRPDDVVDKVHEELQEVQAALAAGNEAAPGHLEEELGDLLHAIASLSRRTGIDPEAALARANLKFAQRFRAMEGIAAASGTVLTEATPAEWDALWEQAKRSEASAADR